MNFKDFSIGHDFELQNHSFITLDVNEMLILMIQNKTSFLEESTVSHGCKEIRKNKFSGNAGNVESRTLSYPGYKHSRHTIMRQMHVPAQWLQ